MASFQKYTTKQGQMWLFKLDTGINPETGKRQTTTRRGFRTKKEALQAASRVEQELANGLSLSNNNLTYKDVFDQWFSNHSKTIKTSTQKSIESKFSKHIIPRFGKLKIKEINKTYCQQMINEIAQLITSVNDIKIQANQVFKYAVKMDIITKNPLEHVSIPRLQKELYSEENEAAERNYWNKDDMKQFLAITKQELALRDYVLFHLLIYTGARKGEILALTWDDIDLETGSIRFTKTLFHNKGEFIFQTSKTKESRRLISLSTQTTSLLKKWRIRQSETNLAIVNHLEDRKMVFTRDDGSPLRLAYPNEKLEIVIKKHQLHRITIHGLRHTHASLLFEAGASIKEVQERLGHSDIKMTMNIYTHVTDTLKEQTAQKFQRYIEL
ncbi:site-specific integrase [Peribacillus psychrosaccharolyticus]|uniref:Site-specific integrase n=1 Tax=Peribacillus psychrosaccharolyticus TaxID=1407 RepID=A0A974NJ88_PERPY|nr:site-specific integrase [Peribacillus psychrosaccharolyticus]MEC2057980.1 site-specific integrase [Peribacillus psychrosaccharolyticus]MED3745856.1 site-specific integrase [Peribacillus psychrosaccharolyticus]QQS98738.1 site-specific integrase [Peribacillus psychrosaccharolyticus]